MILRRFRPRSQDRSIRDLYGAIVAQSRRPAFYRGYGVPDTVHGRFDLIVLHLVLVLERFGRGDGAGRGIGRGVGQELFDVFCRDLDANLREMGVGDLAVPKRMREFGEAFYGRQAAYRTALDAADARELEKALRRNIFAGAGAGYGAARLASYARVALRQFATQEDAALLRGEVVFPEPESIAETVHD
jgi:cytochrome b pre-mRNA-processing protein 3